MPANGSQVSNCPSRWISRSRCPERRAASCSSARCASRTGTVSAAGSGDRRDRHRRMEILASRMLIRPADYERSLRFYRDQLGLAIAREYGAGTVFYAGQSLIELAGHGGPDAGGTMWLQVRDIYATQDELRGRDVPIARDARQEPW